MSLYCTNSVVYLHHIPKKEVSLKATYQTLLSQVQTIKSKK